MALAAGCGTRLNDAQIIGAANASPGSSTQSIGAGGGASADTGDGSSSTSSQPGGGGSSNPAAGGINPAAGGINPAAAGTQSATTSGPESVVGGTGGSTGASAGGDLSPVVIGNVGTYSGVIGSIFSGVQQSLKVAVAYVNAHGGLNGHPIDLVSADDGADPSTNETEVQTMVEQDHAIAFVAQYTPLSSSGSEQFLASRGIPVVGGDLYDPNWYDNPDWFPQGTSLEPGIATTFQALPVKLNKPKIGILYCIETPICSNAVKYSESHPVPGAKIVYTSPISLTQPSFTAQCLDAQNAGVEILLVSADPASIGRVAQDCAAQGIHFQIMEPAVSTTVSQESDADLAGLLAPLEDFLWFQDNTPATQAFHDAFRTYLPSLQLDEDSAEVWSAVQLLKLGSAHLPASNPTSGELVAGLDALGTTNIGGLSPSSITFHAGRPATGTGCYTLAEVVNGAWTAPDGDDPLCNA